MLWFKGLTLSGFRIVLNSTRIELHVYYIRVDVTCLCGGGKENVPTWTVALDGFRTLFQWFLYQLPLSIQGLAITCQGEAIVGRRLVFPSTVYIETTFNKCFKCSNVSVVYASGP